MRPKDLRQGSGTKTFLDAMHGGKVHLARFILDALDGRIINSKTENSRTPLMHAACLQDPSSRAKFTHLLLDRGAEVNCQDEDGRTALSLACEMGHLDVVKLLVQFNADPDISDVWGNSALICPRSHSQDSNQGNSWGLPPQIDKCQNETDESVLFAAKQLQNCQLRDSRITKTLNSVPEISQKEVSKGNAEPKQAPETSSAWGKAKSFNMELVSGRKQSYQGDIRDLGLSASRLKRASLQDERCLLDKRDIQGNSKTLAKEADITVPKCQVMDTDTPGLQRVHQKRGSLGPPTRHNKLLFARDDIDPGKGPSRAPGFVGLGTRLLRRFTAPEFMKTVMDCSSSSSQNRSRISRSETFPFSHTHQQVNSQPSVDSISAVKCEFESCSSQNPLD
uniref:Uncharacterized protein n=1 Tax=Knipowitschia caucasica TaxID=637954 RepID=A0AAV2JBN0_KNICA